MLKAWFSVKSLKASRVAPCREIEGVAVPVRRGRNPNAPTRRDHEASPSAVSVIGKYPTSTAFVLVDPRAGRRGHDLGAEARAEQRLAGGEALFDQADLVREEGIDVRIVNADGAAEHDHQIGGGGIDRPDVVVERLDDVEREAVTLQYGAERAEVIDGRLPDDEGAFAGPWRQWAHPQSGSPHPPPDFAAFAALIFLPRLGRWQPARRGCVGMSCP